MGFCQKLLHFHRNWNKWFFYKIWEKILDFPEKPQKNFISYKSVKNLTKFNYIFN